MVSQVNPSDKKIIIVLIIAAIVMVVLIAYAVTALSGLQESQESGRPMEPPEYSLTPPDTPVSKETPLLSPSPSAATLARPFITTLQVTSTTTPSSDPVVVKPFSLSVTPVSAMGRPGETIPYTLRIEGGEGQAEPIHFTLKASALFFTQTYDLGDEQPPFPKTSVYRFTIPSNIPSGITINGVLTATGAGQVREQVVILQVL